MKDNASLASAEIFTIATHGYAGFVLNLRASLDRVGYKDRLVVYALDDAVKADLEAVGVQAHRVGSASQPGWSDWATPEFGRTMAYKYIVALDILRSGRMAFYVDSDIVFLRDPTDHLQVVLDGAATDVVMQVQVPTDTYNAGLWIARPQPNVEARFVELSAMLMGTDAYVDDQETINSWVQEGRLSACALDPELFACGNQFLPGPPIEQGGIYVDRRVKPFRFDRAYLLHFNFLTRKHDKIKAMMRYGALFHTELEQELPLLRRVSQRVRARVAALRRGY